MSKQKNAVLSDKKPTAVVAQPAHKSVTNEVTQQQIAQRAYEIFLARGGEHGRHQDDWAQAERELRLGRQ